jgi:hypothetical protein
MKEPCANQTINLRKAGVASQVTGSEADGDGVPPEALEDVDQFR